MNDMLFDVPKTEPIEEASDIPVKFDLLRANGGALYLTRDGEKAHVIIMPNSINNFKRMGELEFLTGKALILYEEMYGNSGTKTA